MSFSAKRTAGGLIRRLTQNEGPFFLVASLVTISLVVQASLPLCTQRNWPALAAAAAAGAFHLALHWLSPKALHRTSLTIGYLLLQNLLVGLLFALTGNETLLLGLSFLLAGEITGFLRGGWLLWAMLGLQTGLTLPAIAFLASPTMKSWVLLIVPVMGFIVLYVRMYLRQHEARDLAEAQTQRIEHLTRQAERQRLARELHDSLAQGLAGLVMQIDAARAHLDSERPDRVATILDSAAAEARACLKEAREVIDQARTTAPVTGSHLAVVALLDALAAEFDSPRGLRCRFELDSGGQPSPAWAEVDCRELEKLVREALRNVVRHADALNCTIKASLERALIRVIDDGRGFNPEKIPAGHHGLAGMRERAQLLGADLSVESHADRGCAITLQLGRTGAS